MLLAVVVKPKSAKSVVEGLRIDDAGRRELVCRVTQTPEGGSATRAACALVARSLGVPKSAVRCVRGATSRHKQFEVDCAPERVEDWLATL